MEETNEKQNVLFAFAGVSVCGGLRAGGKRSFYWQVTSVSNLVINLMFLLLIGILFLISFSSFSA